MLGEPHNRSRAGGHAPAVAARAAGGRRWAMPDSAADGADDPDGPLPADPAEWSRTPAPIPAPADQAVERRRRRGGSSDWAEAGTGERDWSDEAPEREPPPLPLRLGPMSNTDLLDGVWAILTCRMRTVLGLSAAVIIPAAIVVGLLVNGPALNGNAADDAMVWTIPFVNLWPGKDPTDTEILCSVIAAAVISLAYFVLGGALGRLVVGWYEDVDLTVGTVLAATFRRLPALVIAWAVMGVCQLATLAVCGFGVFVMPLFLLVAPVVVVERRGPFRAIGRSSSLVWKRYGAALVLLVVSFIIERLVVFALIYFLVLVAAFMPHAVAQSLHACSWAFAALVTAPVVAGLPVLLYVDLRVRAEGYDLETEAADLFPEPSDVV